ncbi:hypothetical protein AC579_2696 [Pseudocercospora musae]|uniref:Uncharacterized protein n=1 Tax=Pseudocercospora musae TaxID=113226 RepID=A0A139IVG0_9PEZI|nr:hypothetical protein AC579_2696 [Pseudocercospora musae]KXT18723.1 hypothetical protein AC579_2696 [Pseudocercospora musae]KXT18724.1 hypothetical protein AC579_2696 [Pseudocercospora musae]KXT18725.1 hypothetical protein AC579_2696 [Pseudocercospora musae]
MPSRASAETPRLWAWTHSMKVLRTLTAVHSGSWPVVDAMVRIGRRDSRDVGVCVGRPAVLLERYKKFDVMRKCGIKLGRMQHLGPEPLQINTLFPFPGPTKLENVFVIWRAVSERRCEVWEMQMQSAVMGNTPAVANGGEVDVDVAVAVAVAVAGRKRRADESSVSSDAERFAKRFNLLNLGAINGAHGNSNYYIPLSPSPSPSPAATKAQHVKAAATSNNEPMQVDETRDRVYIHNLDEELAGLESDEEKLIFLPDIEKYFSNIPKHVLTARRDDDHEGQELVLYGVPSPLTSGEGSNAVRKAIIESRQRAREKAAEDARQQDMNCKYENGGHDIVETAHGYGSGYETGRTQDVDADPDAMDMD